MAGTGIELERKIDVVLGLLTLEEKIKMIHGAGLFQTGAVERLNIPPVKMSDGPMGVRNEFQNDAWKPLGLSDDYVTYCPSNGALAMTWNRELAKKAGTVLGEEAHGSMSILFLWAVSTMILTWRGRTGRRWSFPTDRTR